MSAIAVHIISRTGRNHWLLESWLRKHGIRSDWILAPYALAQGKNASVVEFLKGGDGFLLQLDDDIVPSDQTLPIMDISEDIALAYCAYPPRKSVKGVLGKVMSGCMRIRRDILEAIARDIDQAVRTGVPDGMMPRWFAPRLDPTGRCQMETEEHLVVKKCLDMGHTPVRVGYAGHLVEVVAKYAGGQTAFGWPHEIRT